jgi:uncharacterized protein involved in exopolysaccharide biosynthesis
MAGPERGSVERGPGARGERAPGDGPVYVLPPYPPYAEADEVDLMDYARALWARRRLVLSVVAVCTLVSVAVAFLLPPVYRATAVIAPVEDDSTTGLSALMGQLGGLAPLTGLPVTQSDNTQKDMAILTSRAFTARLVEDNHLMPILFADEWDAGAGRWKVPADEAPTMWDAYREFDEIRNVEQDPKTGLVTVSIEWGDPKVAAAWVQLHIDTLNRHLQQDAVKEAEDSIAYLTEQVERTSNVEMRQTLYNLVEAQTKNAMLARVREDYAFKVIDPPVPPDERARPRRTLIVVGTLLASTLLAAVWALVAEFTARARRGARPGDADAPGGSPPGPDPAPR